MDWHKLLLSSGLIGDLSRLHPVLLSTRFGIQGNVKQENEKKAKRKGENINPECKAEKKL